MSLVDYLAQFPEECICCPMGLECSVPGAIIKGKDIMRTNCEGEALDVVQAGDHHE